MSTAITSTYLVSSVIYDEFYGDKKGFEKYSKNIEKGKRLRGNDSLASPGFTFEDFEEIYVEPHYLGLNHEYNFVLKDGYYPRNNQKYLLRSNRSVSEIFNGSSIFNREQSSIIHRTYYEPAYEYVEVSTYERKNQKTLVYPYTRVFRFETTDSSDDYTYPAYNKDSFDLSVRSFLVDTNHTDKKEIVLNQVHSVVSRVETTATDLSEYINVLDSFYSTNHEILFPFYPLDSTAVQLYTYDTASTNMILWTQTSTIASTSTSRIYTLNAKEGIARLNTNISDYGTAYLGYKTLPMITYYLDEQEEIIEVTDEQIGRIVDDPKHGSYYLCLDQNLNEDIEIILDIETVTQYGNSWKGFYYSLPWQEVKMLLQNKVSKEPLASEKVEISVLNNIGKIKNKTIYTDEEGRASFYYKPYSLKEAHLISTTSNSTTLVNNLFQYLDTDISNIYTYSIWKDDPLVGSTSTNSDSVEWNSSLMNGRKVIFYEWSTSVFNPVTNTQGAYSPTRPSLVSGTSLYYSTSLPTYDATDTAYKIGGISIIGDLKANIQIVSKNQTSSVVFYNQLSNKQKGNIEYLGREYPFGFKIYSTQLNVSNEIGGALYLTINPHNSQYYIIYEGGYYKSIANNLDFKFNIV